MVDYTQHGDGTVTVSPSKGQTGGSGFGSEGTYANYQAASSAVNNKNTQGAISTPASPKIKPIQNKSILTSPTPGKSIPRLMPSIGGYTTFLTPSGEPFDAPTSQYSSIFAAGGGVGNYVPDRERNKEVIWVDTNPTQNEIKAKYLESPTARWGTQGYEFRPSFDGGIGLQSNESTEPAIQKSLATYSSAYNSVNLVRPVKAPTGYVFNSQPAPPNNKYDPLAGANLISKEDFANRKVNQSYDYSNVNLSPEAIALRQTYSGKLALGLKDWYGGFEKGVDTYNGTPAGRLGGIFVKNIVGTGVIVAAVPLAAGMLVEGRGSAITQFQNTAPNAVANIPSGLSSQFIKPFDRGIITGLAEGSVNIAGYYVGARVLGGIGKEAFKTIESTGTIAKGTYRALPESITNKLETTQWRVGKSFQAAKSKVNEVVTNPIVTPIKNAQWRIGKQVQSIKNTASEAMQPITNPIKNAQWKASKSFQAAKNTINELASPIINPTRNVQWKLGKQTTAAMDVAQDIIVRPIRNIGYKLPSFMQNTQASFGGGSRTVYSTTSKRIKPKSIIEMPGSKLLKGLDKSETGGSISPFNKKPITAYDRYNQDLPYPNKVKPMTPLFSGKVKYAKKNKAFDLMKTWVAKEQTSSKEGTRTKDGLIQLTKQKVKLDTPTLAITKPKVETAVAEIKAEVKFAIPKTKTVDVLTTKTATKPKSLTAMGLRLGLATASAMKLGTETATATKLRTSTANAMKLQTATITMPKLITATAQKTSLALRTRTKLMTQQVNALGYAQKATTTQTARGKLFEKYKSPVQTRTRTRIEPPPELRLPKSWRSLSSSLDRITKKSRRTSHYNFGEYSRIWKPSQGSVLRF